MLRLRPSELTLTPADFDETRRRIERQTGRPLRHRTPAARLVRGPERSRDDAVAQLDHIPILRPHQAVHASVHAPIHDSSRDPDPPAGTSTAGTIAWPITPQPARDAQVPLRLRGQSSDGTINLEGYPDVREGYSFRERGLHTEPRQRAGQRQQSDRKLSSTSDPSIPAAIRPDASEASFSDDVFWTSPAPDPPSRRFSSEASSASLPYSYYELPPSRHSSADHSQELPISQHDGAASSRGSTGGAYFSIRPSRANRASTSRLPSVPSRHSSPDLSLLSQQDVSPLPASPYARRLITADDLVGPGQDAASAVQRDLSSPLDLFERRATSYFSRISAVLHPEPLHPGPSQGESSVLHGILHQVAGVADRPRRSGIDSLRHASGRPHLERPSIPPSHRRSDHPVNWYPARQTQPGRRVTSTARASQRSSENVPVDTLSREGRPATRIHQTSVQRVSLGQIQNSLSGGSTSRVLEQGIPPLPLRFSLPQPSPRDMSNRIHLHASYRAGPNRGSRNLHERAALGEPPVPESLSPRHARNQVSQQPVHHGIRPPQIPPRRGSQRVNLRRPASYSSNSVTTTADAATLQSGRLPPVARTATSRRRMDLRQQNQENSGDAENGLVREELAAAGMRYASNGQLEVMDDTPPRLGRLERRFLD